MSNKGRLVQSFGTELGVTYSLSVDVLSGSYESGGGEINVGTSIYATDLVNITVTTPDTYTDTFVGTGNTVWIELSMLTPGEYIDFDNVSITTPGEPITTVEGGLWQLIAAMQANDDELIEDMGLLAFIRDPLLTPVLDDLEKEYGLPNNTNITETDRRALLAAWVYDGRANGSASYLQDKLHEAGFTNLFVHTNDPAVDPDPFFDDPDQIYMGDTGAQMGEADVMCSNLEAGFMLVNGNQYFFEIDYLAFMGDTLQQMGEPEAMCGDYSGVSRELIDYPTEMIEEAWPFVFFVAAEDAVRDVDGFLTDIPYATVPREKITYAIQLIAKIKPLHSWCGFLVRSGVEND